MPDATSAEKPAAPATHCPWCGQLGHLFPQCPRVKALEFYKSQTPGSFGQLARVEFVTPRDMALADRKADPNNPNRWPTS